MNCMVCHQPLDQAPHVQWFAKSPFKGQHHLKCPAKPKAGSPAQREKALAAANIVRLARAELKRSIAGGYPLQDALDAPAASGMTLYSLLISQCQWGPTKAERFLKPLVISPYKTVGSLTLRQRAAVIDALDSAGG